MVETIFQPGAYTVVLPFQPISGGRGLALLPTATPASIALPARVLSQAQTCMATNDSSVTWFLAFGDSGATATLADLPVLPGTQVVFTMPNDGTYTHAAFRTRSGSATGTLNFGLGI